MARYTNFGTKNPIHIDAFTSHRLKKYGANFGYEFKTSCGFYELYLNSNKKHTLEIVAIGEYVHGYRTLSRKNEKEIKLLISIIENEFATNIYDYSNYRHPTYCDTRNGGMIESTDPDDLGYRLNEDEAIWDQLQNHRRIYECMDIPNEDDKFGVKNYYAHYLAEKQPELLSQKNKNELLIRINALYRDHSLRMSLNKSERLLEPILEYLSEIQSKPFEEHERAQRDDMNIMEIATPDPVISF